MPDDAWWDDLGPAFHAAIRAAERGGRMTYRELDAVLPSREASSTEIEARFVHLRDRGIALCEDEAPG